MNAYQLSKSSGSVVSQLSTAHQEQIKKNRLYIKYLIEFTLYLAKQGIAFRGHNEDENSLNQGNEY